MAVRRSATRGLFVVLSWGAGCQLVSGLPDDLSLGTGGGGAAPIVCVREDAPEAPAAQDVGGAEGFVVALRAIDVEKEADGQLPGLNLDGLCSCTEDERACRSLDASSGKGFCDDGSGRDAGSNAFFGALAYMLDPEGMSRYLSKLVEGGAWTLLLRVQGYSGTDDDDQVEVAWYGSLGLSASPQWQGADAWPIRSEFVAPSPEDPHAPTFKDPAAYVTGGKLVARLPVASLPIEGGSLGAMRMELSSVVLVARIEKVSGGRYHLRDGRIGAKVPVPEALRHVRELPRRERHHAVHERAAVPGDASDRVPRGRRDARGSREGHALRRALVRARLRGGRGRAGVGDGTPAHARGLPDGNRPHLRRVRQPVSRRQLSARA